MTPPPCSDDDLTQECPPSSDALHLLPSSQLISAVTTTLTTTVAMVTTAVPLTATAVTTPSNKVSVCVCVFVCVGVGVWVGVFAFEQYTEYHVCVRISVCFVHVCIVSILYI